MKKESNWLFEHRENIYSQSGEDGVIRKILEIIPESNNWCVEFGAWDGIHYSNTKSLIDNSYSAVLIEGSKQKFKVLTNTFKHNKNVIAINDFVGFSKNDNLDKLLENTPTPTNFDFLSIDVDGNDYHIWKAAKHYNAKLVCIEFNPTIPTEVHFIQPANLKINQGASLSAIVQLGKEKGYELVSVLPFNAFFVKKEYFDLFEIKDNSPLTLRQSSEFITHIFIGYDGKVFLHGNQELTWHGIEMDSNKIQQIPKIFRKFPGGFNKFEQFLFYWYKKLFK